MTIKKKEDHVIRQNPNLDKANPADEASTASTAGTTIKAKTVFPATNAGLTAEARVVQTAWFGGVPESVRTGAGRPCAPALQESAEPARREAGQGFTRFWSTTCLYWASNPQSLLKK